MLSRAFGMGARGLSTVAKQREQRHLKIYAPFSKPEWNSPEYKELALSGKVWEDHHQPADSQKQGYARLQQEHARILQEIDRIRKAMSPPLIAKQLVSECAHQSVQIENNHLDHGESQIIYDFLTATVFHPLDMASLSIHDLCDTALPDVTHLSPGSDKDQVIELRNHLVASQWIAETASRNPGTAGLGEHDIHELSALTMKDLGQDGWYRWAWGGKTRLGDYRQTPISVRSDPLRIFPYHIEVPACMRRFFQWRDEADQKKTLHPLILACQATVYFVHIHPFPDGNGRVSRMLMHDYMVRQGYLPVVMQGMERQDYIKMVSDAMDGGPDEFVVRVLTTQLEALQTFKFREFG